MSSDKEPNWQTPTVRPNHSFFWNTDLTLERMQEISDWIGTLSKEDRKKLDDLLTDVREDVQWNENQEGW